MNPISYTFLNVEPLNLNFLEIIHFFFQLKCHREGLLNAQAATQNNHFFMFLN